MSDKIKTAVILAAGMGSRLGADNHNKPKGLIEIGPKPIIHESIEKLKKENIKKIILVTGYQDQLYNSYVEKNFSNITIVKNLEFQTTSTLYSLSKVRNLIEEDFLLLESDLIYDFDALNQIISCQSENVVLLSKESGSGDEVYVETRNNNLLNMSKDLNKLGSKARGEFVGINKISNLLFLKMMNLFDNIENKESLTYEEDALCYCAKFMDIECLKLNDLLWSEIDTKEHLARAKEIYKLIN